MKLRFARLLRRLATALHRVAAFFNEQAYLVEHGRETEVDKVASDPLGVLLAECRQFVGHQELNSRKGGDCGAAVDIGKIEGQIDEGLVHQIDGPANADSGVIHDAYLAWLKSVENKPGWEFLARQRNASPASKTRSVA